MSQFVSQLQVFLAKAEARDKSGRFAQYGARIVVGLIAYLLEHKYVVDRDTIKDLQTWQTKARNVMSMISDARRTHRWGKEVATVSKLKDLFLKIQKDWSEILNFVSKVILVSFFIRDHIAWLCKVKILSTEPKKVIRANLRWYVVSHALQAAYMYVTGFRCFLDWTAQKKSLEQIKFKRIEKRRKSFENLRRSYSQGLQIEDSVPEGKSADERGQKRNAPSQMQENGQKEDPTGDGSIVVPPLAEIGYQVLEDRKSVEEEELEKKMEAVKAKFQESFLQAFKSCLLILQGLHNSQWYVMHDLPVGIMGVATATVDVYKQWPAPPKPPRLSSKGK